jgi:transposase
VCADELDPDRLHNLFEIGIDEVSWRRQHRYLTLVADHIRGQIVWGTEGNDAAAADRFFKELGKSRAEAIEVISLDMGPGYAKSAREHAPKRSSRSTRITFVALANRALTTSVGPIGTSCEASVTATPPAASKTRAGRC